MSQLRVHMPQLRPSAAKVKALCDPVDGSPQGSTVPGSLQARTLEWVAISCSNAWKWKVKVKSFSRVRLLATPWTAAYQAPPSMGFSRQECWSGEPLPSPSLSLLPVIFSIDNKTLSLEPDLSPHGDSLRKTGSFAADFRITGKQRYLPMIRLGFI